MSDKKQATSDKTSDKRLLPCPFCGGEIKGGVRLTGYMMLNSQYIKCDACGVEMQIGYTIDGLSQTYLKAITEDLIRKWNTRKPVDEVLEHLEEELNFADIEMKRCAQENPLQFDSAKGCAEGLYIAIKNIKEGLKGDKHE